MSYNQLISDLSTYVKKRAQRSEDSGTGPDEHLLSDFEHMKASLYLTVFLGLEITKSSKGFEVKNMTDLVQSLLNLYGLENSKPTANLGRRSTVMELSSAISL